MPLRRRVGHKEFLSQTSGSHFSTSQVVTEVEMTLLVLVGIPFVFFFALLCLSPSDLAQLLRPSVQSQNGWCEKGCCGGGSGYWGGANCKSEVCYFSLLISLEHA